MKIKFGVAFIVCLSLGLSATKVLNVNVEYFDKNKIDEAIDKCPGNEVEKKICKLRIEYHATIASIAVFEAVYQGIKDRDPDRVDPLIQTMTDVFSRTPMSMGQGMILGFFGIISTAKELIEEGNEEEYAKIVDFLDDSFPNMLAQAKEPLVDIVKNAESLGDSTLSDEFYVDPIQ